jgi:hypothetical protein
MGPLAALTGVGTAVAESTYQPWAGSSQAQPAQQTSVQRLQELVTSLRALTQRAEDADAADPNFITDLEKLAAKYEVLGGPGTVFLHDTFKDGNYTSNPAWKVTAGSWEVDVEGTTTGLRSTFQQPSSGKITGNDVLNAILGVQKEVTRESTYASIHRPAKISNAFKMTMKLRSDGKGPLNVGPYQGAAAESAYRMVYQPDTDSGLVLQRVSGNQVTEIARYNDPINLEDGQSHELVWQRDTTGKMRIHLDGQQLIIATDQQLIGAFDGWMNINQGGSYWIREIKVEGV